MTTATPGFRTTPVAPGVREAALSVLVVGTLAVVAAALFATKAAVLGVVIGTVMVLFFFGFGALVVNFVAGLLPSAALLVAMLTYTLQVVLLAVAFAALNTSGALDKDVDANWLGLTVIVEALTWTFAQIVGATRARQPMYDLPPDRRPSAEQPGGGGSE